jgi:lipopolysaccharide/colanic/teichoic acid biosynthesis glycosyltransferase
MHGEGHSVIRIVAASGSAPERAVARSRAKRIFDVTIAGIGLVLLAPLIILLSAAIVIDSGWPPLFAQRRVGAHGRTFRMWKFRTMRRDAEEGRALLLDRNEAPFPVFKLRDDPRVTRVGRVLRRASLDELPQLWNVVRGEMSLVGPRPPLPEEVARYDALALGRLAARPGITCTWQVERRRRRDIPFDEWVRMDLAYLGQERWDPLTDVRLIVRTLAAIARFSGE